MIIKLPICVNEKIIFSNFLLQKFDDKYVLSIFNRKYETNITKIKVPLCNNYDGISYLDLYFPLELKIFNNKIVFNNFMQKIFLSQNKLHIDFFSQVENYLNNDNISFISLEDLDSSENDIWEYLLSYDDIIKTENSSECIKDIWTISQLYINFGIFLLYKNINSDNKVLKKYQQKFKIPKKFVEIVKLMRCVKYSINESNNYNFDEHNSRLISNKITINNLQCGLKYFVKSLKSNKFFQIQIKDIDNNIIYTNSGEVFIFEKYEWYYYLMNLNYDINLIMFNLLKNNNIYNIVFEKTNLGIEPVHTNKMLEYYLSDKECSLIYLRSFFENDFSDFKILQNNNYSNVFFEYITKKYSSNINDIIEIYKILFDNYSYPIKQNKIDSSFDNLLYFSLINLEKICSYTNNKILINNDINIIIPQKLRILFYNIIQLFYSILIKKNYEILYFNQRFFNDYLHRFILKHILFNKISTSSNYFLSKLNPIEKDKIDNILKNTLLCIDIANRLNWTNLPKKLHYLEFFYLNRELIFNFNKLNKNIFSENYDYRIKIIIEQPLEMFKILKKEKDCIKWLQFINTNIFELYDTKISLSSEEIYHLGKIIYLLTSIEEQNTNNESYTNFLDYCSKYPHLILYENRVNLKIKEYFSYTKCHLNLGYLAKHILYYNNDNNESISQDIINLQQTLKSTTQKYNKYKIKYYKSKDKTNPNNDILSETSIMN